MRFLHTSDWHIGKTLRGRSRNDEYEQALAEICDIAVSEKVDCILVSGDLFDSFAPSAEAERLVFYFLSELSGRGIPAVIISGNHDHPKRLEALRPLLEPLGILVRTRPGGGTDGGMVEIPSGTQLARIGVLPFISHAKLIRADELFGDQGKALRTYSDRLTALLTSLGRDYRDDAINIILGHFFVASASQSGSERAIHAGIPYEVPSQAIPAGFQYVAVGHLHRPQSIPAPSPLHYAGSLLQLDFGEQGQQKQVSLIEARPRTPATVKSIPLTSGRPLMELEGSLEELRNLSDRVGNAYLKIHLCVPQSGKGMAEQVREIFPNAVDIQLLLPGKTPVAIPQRLGKLSPEGMFGEFYSSSGRPPPGKAVLTLFRELYAEAVHATD